MKMKLLPDTNSYKKSRTMPCFLLDRKYFYECFSDKYRSASMAAIQPEPAAVTA